MMRFASVVHERLFEVLATRLRGDAIDDADIYHIVGEYSVSMPEFACNLCMHIRDMLREQGTTEIAYGELLIEAYGRCLFDVDAMEKYHSLALAYDVDMLRFFVETIAYRPRGEGYAHNIVAASTSLQ